VVAYDIDEKKYYTFTDCEDNDTRQPLSDLIPFLDDCRVLIAHNQMMYDIPVLRKLIGWIPSPDVVFYDTMILSQVLNYKRFGFGHSLAKWGEFLNYAKVEHEEWNRYSPEMRKRCQVDVELNVKVWEHLSAELQSRKNKETLKLGIRGEHYASYFTGRANAGGWPFDVEAAKLLLTRIGHELLLIKEVVEPQLKLKIAQLDNNPEFKSPAWIKNGDYAARTAGWFEISPRLGQEEDRPIWGDYCRVQAVKPDIGSMESVKGLLFSLGWVPDEYNYVKNAAGKLIQSTPKLTESSLEPLGKIGEMIGDFYSLRARHSVLQTWIDSVVDGRLHGDCFVIGTPTGRARHEIIANIPSADAKYGPEIRALFIAPPGYVVVGVDSKGNQNRALAHYLNNKDYTEAVCTGDIHEYNKGILETILGNMGAAGRKKAKAFFYALIFAGGAGKLALITTGKRDPVRGSVIKESFLKGIPGLKKLVSSLEDMFTVTQEKTGKGYILALDGRPIFMEAARLALNYLLQSFEKITVSLSIQQVVEELDRGRFDWQPLIFYHDEIQFYVKEDQAEAAKEISLKTFKEAPNKLGVSIMEGSAAIGKNWFETH
jgi:DNA polymerase-1